MVTKQRMMGNFAGCAALIFAVAQVPAEGQERSFSSPQEAAQALVSAAANHNTNTLLELFGPEEPELISPDPVAASEAHQRFLRRAGENIQVATNEDASATLRFGADGWPFPVPLVLTGGQWHFDTAAGKQEIFARRIGRDELGAIGVCHAYVEAQREYASQDHMGDGVLAYAQYLHSTAGRRDGLYWPPQPGEPLSPLGPLVAQARAEGYHRPASMLSEELAPYHGYYFKILARQGRHAPGGKYSYLINGHMIAGFALVAWPAAWGNTGIMTFIVNQQGQVYEKNLGSKTARVAARMTAYDPDPSWKPVP